MRDQDLLVADIGGTNARFALAKNGAVGYSDVQSYQCADYSTPIAAIRHYLDATSAADPAAFCLAAAGPVVNNTISVTNNDWTLSANEFRSEFATSTVQLLNDFEAIAWSIPHIDSQFLEPVGQPSKDALPEGSFSVAIIGPGTGLGMGGLYKRNGCLMPIVGEGGHIGFAPKSKTQIEILEVLRDKFERVCIERLLSGPGIEHIYWALHVLRGDKRQRKSSADIFAAALDGTDVIAADATQLFYEVLGQVAGDLALILGATDGVYIAGGITKRYPEMLHISGFRNAFENKGRHRSLMERIPTRLITCDEPGLLGASSCLANG